MALEQAFKIKRLLMSNGETKYAIQHLQLLKDSKGEILTFDKPSEAEQVLAYCCQKFEEEVKAKRLESSKRLRGRKSRSTPKPFGQAIADIIDKEENPDENNG